MDDKQVIEAFILGDRQGYGPGLHIEYETLMAFGWWHMGFRLTPQAFIVRNDDEHDPQRAPLIKLLQQVLSDHGLTEVRDSHPLVQPVTYTEMSLAGPTWAVWAPDRQTGDAALALRAGADAIPKDLQASDLAEIGDFSAELEGARRSAGLPPSVILALGLTGEQVKQLQVSLPECRFEQRQFGQIRPESCSDVSPALALINAQNQQGINFIMELRAVACGRFLPIAAVAAGADPPAGADVALNPEHAPSSWTSSIQNLLP